MDYIYINIHRFEGISSHNLEEDKIIYQDDSYGITVILTNNINNHCSKLDIRLACVRLLLHGMFNNEKIGDIEAEVTKIQEERASKKEIAVYAVIIIKGNAQLNINQALYRETDQFHMCFDAFDAIDNKLLQKTHREKVNSIISSLSISTSPQYYINKEISGIYFIDENGKPLYDFTVQFLNTRVIISKPIDSEKENEIAKIIKFSISNQELEIPFRLFTQSLKTTQDKLRSFTSAWSALEIFTNKVFSSYEKKFIENITAGDHNSYGVNQFLSRIKEVMKDKYRLTDKFSLIASFLSDHAEEDIKLFKDMKKLRDDIVHGQEFNEETLPVEDARKLVANYLKSYILLTVK